MERSSALSLVQSVLGGRKPPRAWARGARNHRFKVNTKQASQPPKRSPFYALEEGGVRFRTGWPEPGCVLTAGDKAQYRVAPGGNYVRIA